MISRMTFWSAQPEVILFARFLPMPSISCRHLLQGRQLDPRRPNHWTRKEVHRPPSDHPHQGHLALPAAQGLRQSAVPIASAFGFANGFTECLLLLAMSTNCASGKTPVTH